MVIQGEVVQHLSSVWHEDAIFQHCPSLDPLTEFACNLDEHLAGVSFPRIALVIAASESVPVRLSLHRHLVRLAPLASRIFYWSDSLKLANRQSRIAGSRLYRYSRAQIQYADTRSC